MHHRHHCHEDSVARVAAIELDTPLEAEQLERALERSPISALPFQWRGARRGWLGKLSTKGSSVHLCDKLHFEPLATTFAPRTEPLTPEAVSCAKHATYAAFALEPPLGLELRDDVGGVYLELERARTGVVVTVAFERFRREVASFAIVAPRGEAVAVKGPGVLEATRALVVAPTLASRSATKLSRRRRVTIRGPQDRAVAAIRAPREREKMLGYVALAIFVGLALLAFTTGR